MAGRCVWVAPLTHRAAYWPRSSGRFLHYAMDVARRRIPNGRRPDGRVGPELGAVPDTEPPSDAVLRPLPSDPISAPYSSASILLSCASSLRPIGRMRSRRHTDCDVSTSPKPDRPPARKPGGSAGRAEARGPYRRAVPPPLSPMSKYDVGSCYVGLPKIRPPRPAG